ncbi:aminotransferase class V-fold PLP-dependent enzyme [Marihabitans asiaticum]|uniref:Kynureninase n=1 Tax=Marihabitans asiaticum TaxID=415218 RepID=A0A560W9U6_9MICO|nr:kynureninase [Marihabitans asiaticum]TWD14320.1 kynureninase [Marihabitans asiaticum]
MSPAATPVDIAALDAADPLRGVRDRFVAADDPAVAAYLDGNSLGRPPRALLQRYEDFIAKGWGTRLIRGWDEGWFERPITLGDRIGRLTLGAAPGQTAVADSTTVCLYKLVRAAVDLRPDRAAIVLDRGNFPTDRYVVEGIAAETGRTVRWIDPDPRGGVTPEDVAAAVDEDTAVVELSHVAYRSGHVADLEAITALAHEAGALVVWDLCHSVGVLPLQLDTAGVDMATGCTYKYLNGGPGSPAFLYVRNGLIEEATQPIQGWMGVRDSFEMGPGYDPAPSIRRFISGTPPVLAMLAMEATLDIIEEVGIEAIRAKSTRLTQAAIGLVDERLADLGVELGTPRDPERRGGHVTIDHPAFEALMPALWEQGVIPDFRPPSGIRLGLAPLTTSFAELEHGIDTIADLLRQQ